MYFKGLSFKQPYANLILSGKKILETRSWKTEYRGSIVICVSKSPKIEPYGLAVGSFEIDSIEDMEFKHESDACISIYPKAKIWHMKNLVKYLKEDYFQVNGSLGLFEIVMPIDILEKYYK